VIRISKIIPFLILLISAISLNSHSNIFNTQILFGFYFIIVSLFLFARNKLTTKQERKFLFWPNIYLIWIVISIFRGFFMADNYWDYKALTINAFGLLMILATYISLNPHLLQQILSVYLKYIIPLFILYIPFLDTLVANGFIVYAFAFISWFFLIWQVVFRH